MKEARVILPSLTRFGAPVANQLISACRAAIAKLFGGYTSSKGCGGFVNSQGTLVEEPIEIVDIATDSKAQLEGFAKQLALEAQQESVYLRLPNGDVEFVKGESK